METASHLLFPCYGTFVGEEMGISLHFFARRRGCLACIDDGARRDRKFMFWHYNEHMARFTIYNVHSAKNNGIK